jgi:hypothetical protein
MLLGRTPRVSYFGRIRSNLIDNIHDGVEKPPANDDVK